MSRKRTKLHAKIPAPNDYVTIPVGTKILTETVFRETTLNKFLDSLKRDQGNSVAAEVRALVANCVEMTGISVNRLDRLLEKPTIRAEYDLDNNSAKSIYRTVERIGEHSDEIVKFLGNILKEKIWFENGNSVY